ncbi:MAG: hypothetical protein DA408_08480 [Bacteroidetes bacterium]|nr:MAG: hypothetical protein C7N36_21425 [Bacteroidota bacterium]PTM12989.1 MAG: hypothetical protein DA408_08480 [Bacteroidota bacterium]
MLLSTPGSAGLIATNAFFSFRKEKVGATFLPLGIDFCDQYQVVDSACPAAGLFFPNLKLREQGNRMPLAFLMANQPG